MPDGTRKINLPLQTRLAPIAAVNKASRTVDLVWSTGARVKRREWVDLDNYREYWEELSLDPQHVRMGRLQNGAPLLNSHNRWSLEDQIGVVESASLEAGRGVATARFSTRDDVEPYFIDTVNKIIRSTSVGYITHKFEKLPPDDRSEGLPIYRAIDWEPMEISLVPIGADAGAGVRSEQQNRTFPCEIVETRMPNSEDHNDATETAKPTPAELARLRTIRELVTRNGLPAAFSIELIESGITVAEARQRVIAKLAENTEATLIRSGFSGEADDFNSPAMRVRCMGEALAARFGVLKGELSEPARQFAYMRTHELLRAQLEMFGVRTTGLAVSQIVSRYFEILSRAPSHSVSDFPNLFGDVAQRSLRQGYQSYSGGLKRIARKRTAADFRTIHRIQFGEAPTLNLVLPGGEIKSGTIAESKESYVLATYGRIFGVNRQACINDDLGALTTVPEKYGRAAAEREASCFIDLFSANSGAGLTMADNAPLFGTAHNNYSTGAATGTIDVTTVGVGVAKMRLQKGLDGTTPIDAEPRYLVVPATKETQARQFVATITPAQISDAQPYKLEVVTDPRLDAITAGTTGWYLAADPTTIDTLEYAYLEGQEGVYLETRVGFEIDGLEFKARLDFAAAAIDHRGLFKASGS